MHQDDNITELFRKYINKELSEEELDILSNWLSQSPRNKQTFIAFLSLYKTKIQITAYDQIDEKKAWGRINKRLLSRKTLYRTMWSAAACVAVVLTVGLLYMLGNSVKDSFPKESLVNLYPNQGVKKATLTLSDGHTVVLQNNKDEPIRDFKAGIVGYNRWEHLIYIKQPLVGTKDMYNSIYVPKGSEYTVILSDGSKIYINSESTLKYPIHFTTIRNVLLDGEAYFEVVHNPEAPFVVNTTHGVRVRVLGTKFNISAYKSENMKVTLVEGAIALESSKESKRLIPGNQAQIGADGESSISKVNTDIYTSWVTGRFEFNNASMEDIMMQLSLWYGVDIQFASPELKNILFTGAILKNKSLGYALELIQKVSNLDFEKNGDVIVVKELDK